MNVLNNSSDDVVECPLCMEPLEVDDLNFFPCTCGYQICRFCWHRIRTDENELCPACRKAYPENPADFTPLSQEQIAALKAEKRQRDQQRKQKITENRKHLANVRVVQKNLVFVVGLPPRLADADILKKHEYFGKYGKIHKVVINPSTTYAGVQGPSASAYVTYVHNNDALRAIQSVNNIMIDGRLIKTSLGTTKYCSHFMKNQQCPKADCMYLHELGDPEASFTKEEMHQGKHQEYEKRLHDALIASSNGSVTTNCKNGDNKIANNPGPVHNKEAWPSLSVSPVNKETIKTNGKGSNKENGTKSENRKHDKTKNDKKGQKNQKIQNISSTHNNHNNKENSNATNGIGNNQLLNQNSTKDSTTINNEITISSSGTDIDKQQKQQQNHMNVDDEINLIDHFEKDTLSENNDAKNGDTRSLSSSSSSNNGDSGSLSESTSGKSSPGSFPDHHPLTTTNHETRQILSSSSSSTSSNSSSSALSAGETHGRGMENITAGSTTAVTNSISTQQTTNNYTIKNNSIDINNVNNNTNKNDINVLRTTPPTAATIMDASTCLSKLSLFDDNSSFFSSSSFQPLLNGNKLDIDNNRNIMNNQLDNAISSHLPDLLNGTNTNNNHDIIMKRSHIDNKLNYLKGIDDQNQNTSSIMNNIGGSGNNGINNNSNSLIDNPEKYLLSLNTTEDWEAAFKYVMMRNNKQLEDQQEEYLRMQEMQKRNNLINSINSQVNGGHDFNNSDFLQNNSDLNRLSQQAAVMFQQQQQQRQPNNMHHGDHMMGGTNMFTNMSKFFDFHKNQQQQHQHQFMMNVNGNCMMNDHHLSMATLLENNRINSQYLDHSNGLIGQQLQKQRLLNKYDQMGSHNHNILINTNNNNQQQQTRIHNQFTQNATGDDDLGFDPFFETQKALAELMENEIVQSQQSQNNHSKHLLENCQRTRMPPPGFNHMNAFGFGVPRAQGSKILPFMNNHIGTQQPQQNNWTPHGMGFQQPPPPNQQQQEQVHMAQNQNGNNQHNKTGYGNMSDWTALDPAILSFRQFPSYSSHQHQHPQQQQQHTTPDMFMQHLTQQNVQQSGQGFGHHGINLQNNLMNQQLNSPAQVNYSHANWLNSEQSMFMNSLANGYSRNKQQKAECIN